MSRSDLRQLQVEHRVTGKNRLIAPLLALGVLPEDVARIADVSAGFVHEVSESPLMIQLVFQVKKAINNALEYSTREIMADEFNVLARRAVNVLADLLDSSDNETARLGAAKEALDRADVAPKSKKHIESDNTYRHVITIEELDRLKAAVDDHGVHYDLTEFSDAEGDAGPIIPKSLNQAIETAEPD